VLNDVREGYVSPGAARDQYKVAVRETAGEWELDEAETARLRSSPVPIYRKLSMKFGWPEAPRARPVFYVAVTRGNRKGMTSVHYR
jgi:hypothetical protein